jgi:hypothetical protein
MSNLKAVRLVIILLYDTTYFFAFGLGTSLYAVVRLAKPLFWEGGGSSWESTKIAIAMILGFLCTARRYCTPNLTVSSNSPRQILLKGEPG